MNLWKGVSAVRLEHSGLSRSFTAEKQHSRVTVFIIRVKYFIMTVRIIEDSGNMCFGV